MLNLGLMIYPIEDPTNTEKYHCDNYNTGVKHKNQKSLKSLSFPSFPSPSQGSKQSLQGILSLLIINVFLIEKTSEAQWKGQNPSSNPDINPGSPS